MTTVIPSGGLISLQWQKDAMQELFFLQEANRELLEALRDDSRTDVASRATAEGVVFLSEAAAEQAPWLTGSLSSAFRGKVEPAAGGAVGRVFVDPAVVNPILGGRPVDYGPEVYTEFDNVMAARQEAALTRAENIVLQAIQDIW